MIIKIKENYFWGSRVVESYLLLRFELMKTCLCAGLSARAYLSSVSPHCPFCQVIHVFPLGDRLGTLRFRLQETACKKDIYLCLQKRRESHRPHSPVTSTGASLIYHKYDALCREGYYSQWCPSVIVFFLGIGKFTAFNSTV